MFTFCFWLQYQCNRGRRVIGISGSLTWSKILMELIFYPCDEFRWSPESLVSQIHSPHLHAGAPGIFPDLLPSVQILKWEWDAESNGKLPHLFTPGKTAILVPEFAMEDLPLCRNSALVPEFAVKDLPWVKQSDDIYISSVFCPRAGPSLRAQKPRLQVLPGMNRCGGFPHPILSLASEQTLKDLKRFQRGGEESEFG